MLDESYPDVSRASKSKCRRQRAVALRNCLWKSIQGDKSTAGVDSCQDPMLMSIHSRLAFLESMLKDMHWITIGQWQVFHDTADTSFTTEAPCLHPESAADHSTKASFVDHISAACDLVADRCRNVFEELTEHCRQANTLPAQDSPPLADATIELQKPSHTVHAKQHKGDSFDPSLNNLIELMRRGRVERLDFYPKDWIVCGNVHEGRRIATKVSREELAHLITVGREKHIPITSHLKEKYEPQEEQDEEADDPDWKFLEQQLESCLKTTQNLFANMEPVHEKREEVLDAITESGVTAIQASLKSDQSKTLVNRHLHRLRTTLRLQIASMMP